MRFKETTEKVKIKGHSVLINITVDVNEDDIDPATDFDFGDATENKKYLARFQSGELFIGVITVRATSPDINGLEGIDSLGGCHIHSNHVFNSNPFNVDVETIIHEHGMIQNAVAELMARIVAQALALKKFV